MLALPPELESRLCDCATAAGLSVEKLIAHTFPPRPSLRTFQEFMNDMRRANGSGLLYPESGISTTETYLAHRPFAGATSGLIAEINARPPEWDEQP